MGSRKTCRWRGSRGNTRIVLCCLHGSRSRVFCAEKAWTSLDIFICWCVHLLLQDACMLHSFTLRQQLQTARQGDSILSLHVWPRMTCTLAHLSSPTPPLPFFPSPSLLRIIPCSVPTRCCLPCDCQVDQGGYSCKRRWDILVQGGVVRNSVSLGLSEGGGEKTTTLFEFHLVKPPSCSETPYATLLERNQRQFCRVSNILEHSKCYSL